MTRRPKSSGAAVSIAALLLAAAIGCCHAHAPTTQGVPNFHRVVVGPAESQVDPEELTLWRPYEGKPGDEAFWILIDRNQKLDTTRKLFIEFEKSDAFPENVANEKSRRYRIRCDGAFCQSGPIGKGASGKYKYWQIVVDADGTEHAADGRIIIKP